jgi:Zn-dependent protease with chaperone function
MAKAKSSDGANTNRIKFEALESAAFQHPLDRQATDNLKKLVGFDLVVAKFLEFGFERMQYVYNIASSVKVGPTQMPKLYAMLQESCAILDMSEPELYVTQFPVVNAMTAGHTRPYIMLYTGMLDLMNDDEIMTIIAHELGHIKCGHVLYIQMAWLLSMLASQLTQGFWGLNIVWPMFLAALYQWLRRAELSADRAALLVMQNPRPVISTLTKLAGGNHRFADELDPDQFLEQARIYTKDMLEQKFPDFIYRVIAESRMATHPFAVERVKEIDEWANGEEYANILAGNYPRGVKKIQIKVQAR